MQPIILHNLSNILTASYETERLRCKFRTFKLQTIYYSDVSTASAGEAQLIGKS
jgi:hypothetical protein